MIQDKELRDLFKIECGEHLQRLRDGLLRLEKNPADTTTIGEVFREAHSLKGAARMVGVPDVEMMGHSLEDLIGAAKNGKSVLTPETIDRLFKMLDSIQRLVNEAITGEPSGVDVANILNQFTAVPQPPTAQPPKAETEGAIPPPPTSKKFKIDTVRVGTDILDMLMTQAGELSVTKLYIARRLSEIEEIAGSSEFGVLSSEIQSKIQNLKSKIGENSARLDFITDKMSDGIRNIRLIPLSTIFNLYPWMVRDIARGESKEVSLLIEGGDIAVDKRIIEEMKDPLMHIIRNSIDHGIEKPDEREAKGKSRSGTIKLNAFYSASNVIIEVSDDGKGLDIEEIKRIAVKQKIYNEEELSAMPPKQIESIIFNSGFSTSRFVSDVSGRGVGLDVVRSNVEQLKGTVALESSAGAGCRFIIKLPLTLATMHVLIIEAGGRSYAIPMENIETSRMVAQEDIFTVAGRNTIRLDESPVSVARLSDMLQVRSLQFGVRSKKTETSPDSKLPTPDSQLNMPCIILSVNNERFGLIADNLIDEEEIVLKTQSAILKHVKNVYGVTTLASGEVCIVLNPQDLLKSVRKMEAPVVSEKKAEEIVRKKSILLAEDSITTRTQERQILEGAGYEVVTAVDGLDALNKLNSRTFDAVVSDILMPNMDGLTLISKIRQDKRFKELPVVLVTTLSSDEDKRKGMEAGANGYISKPTFDQKMLLEILGRLV